MNKFEISYSTPPSPIFGPNNWYQSLLIDITNQDPVETKFVKIFRKFFNFQKNSVLEIFEL